MTSLQKLVVAALLFAVPAVASDLDGDRLVIESLKTHGSDLSKPHTIDFFFDFPAKESAQQVCAQLSQEGYAPHLDLSGQGGKYTCRAVKKMVPELKAMQSLTVRFNQLAANNQGVYDGWGCPIVK